MVLGTLLIVSIKAWYDYKSGDKMPKWNKKWNRLSSHLSSFDHVKHRPLRQIGMDDVQGADVASLSRHTTLKSA